MTVDEAKTILDEGRGYEDFDDPKDFIIDGHYSLEELEAILVLARDAVARG